MASSSRRKLLGGNRQGTYHCWARCVRRAFLCGRDPYSKKDYSHRRRWIMEREEQLAALFTIDIEFHTELSNHLHIVLRTCPRAAKKLTPEEVVRRWLTITKLSKCFTDELPEIDEKRVKELAKDKKKVAKLRKRLSKVSWFMGTLLENIARRSNCEDATSGKFWSTRYGCRECTDPGSVLICGIYVDLNLIRAGEASSVKTAKFTSVYQRLQARKQSRHSKSRADGWLAELTLRPERKDEEHLADSSRTVRRATDMGVLPMSLQDYVYLLDWTAQMIKSGKRSTIPKDIESVLDHMQVNPETWLDTVKKYDKIFSHAIGSPDSMEKVAARLGVHHLKGGPAAREVFT